jgi:hypothetical protein
MFDADKTEASPQAYEKLSTGDAFLGFVSYGVTMLAVIGGSRRHETHQPVPIAPAAKAAVDAESSYPNFAPHGAHYCVTAPLHTRTHIVGRRAALFTPVSDASPAPQDLAGAGRFAS